MVLADSRRLTHEVRSKGFGPAYSDWMGCACSSQQDRGVAWYSGRFVIFRNVVLRAKVSTAPSEPASMSNTSLWQICHEQFFRVRLQLRSEKTRIQYRLALNNFAELLGRPATIDDLQDDNLAALAHQLLDRKLSEFTINERVGRLKTLWNWLARRGVVQQFPTLAKLQTAGPIPRAWTKEELGRLFDSCAVESGNIDGIAAGCWWLALMSWLWCTSERKGATFAMTWEMIDLDGLTAVLPPAIRKGRKSACYSLWPECASMLRLIRREPDDKVFPWPFNDGTYYFRYGRILRRAGLPDGRKNKTHAMRVTHATWREATGGDASKDLGHASKETTQRHYLDPRIVKPDSRPMFWPKPLGPGQLPAAG